MIGLIGQKIGMTQRFDSQSQLIAVTAVRVLPNTVVEKHTPERHGYSSVLLSSGSVQPRRLTKAELGQFKSRNLSPQRLLMEVRNFSQSCNIGDRLEVTLFEEIGFVDVIAKCKGKGFQGVIKRHGFHGGRRTHGSKFHREIGSTGMAATPSRVLKGTKMAGRMPARQFTVQNLKVIGLMGDKNLLLLQGAVPGPRGSWLMIREAIKRGAID